MERSFASQGGQQADPGGYRTACLGLVTPDDIRLTGRCDAAKVRGKAAGFRHRVTLPAHSVTIPLTTGPRTDGMTPGDGSCSLSAIREPPSAAERSARRRPRRCVPTRVTPPGGVDVQPSRDPHAIAPRRVTASARESDASRVVRSFKSSGRFLDAGMDADPSWSSTSNKPRAEPPLPESRRVAMEVQRLGRHDRERGWPHGEMESLNRVSPSTIRPTSGTMQSTHS